MRPRLCQDQAWMCLYRRLKTVAYSHVGVYLGDGADAVVMGDGEVMVQHPGGWTGLRPAAAVRGETVQVSHMPMCQEQVVTWAVNIVSHLRETERQKGKNIIDNQLTSSHFHFVVHQRILSVWGTNTDLRYSVIHPLLGAKRTLSDHRFQITYKSPLLFFL